MSTTEPLLPTNTTEPLLPTEPLLTTPAEPPTLPQDLKSITVFLACTLNTGRFRVRVMRRFYAKVSQYLNLLLLSSLPPFSAAVAT